MKKILLTGATGFLGSNLMKGLVAAGYKVVMLKRSTSDVKRVKTQLKVAHVYDIDCVPLEEIFKRHQIDIIIHAACAYGRGNIDPYTTFQANVDLGLKILILAIKHKVKLFVNTDTFYNVETGIMPRMKHYVLSKKQFTEWLRIESSNIAVINMRLQHVYGREDSSDKFIPWVLSRLRIGAGSLDLTLGEQLRDFIWVDDVVSAYLYVISSAPAQGFTQVDVGTGRLNTLRYFLELLKGEYERLQGPCDVEFKFGAVPYDSGELMDVSVNTTHLEGLGWTAKTSIDLGVKKLLEV